MQIIKVTSLHTKTPIYINVDMIGHFYEVEADINLGKITVPKHTVIGSLTHSNGGYKVLESMKEIAQQIINAGNGLANIIKD
jgi:hypothetical protein